MNLWGFALPSEAFNRAPFNWGRSFRVSFCWTVAGWEAYPLDKLCDLLKEYKGWCWKWPAVQTSVLLWGWDVSCRELFVWVVREPPSWKHMLVPTGGTSIHPQNQRETWKSPLEKHNHLQTSTIHAFQKSGFSCSPPKKAQPPVSWPQSPRRLQDLRMQTAPESSTTDRPMRVVRLLFEVKASY